MVSNTKRIRRLTGLVAAIGATFGGLAVADADTVTLQTGEMLLEKATPGPIKRNSGTGKLDMASAALLANNKILVCGMGSTATDANPNSKIEAFCGTVQLSATGAPTNLVPLKQMTDYGRNRGFRKGTLAAPPGANWAIMGFASTVDNPNNPQHYVRIVDENANWLTERIRINQNTNSNHGASQMLYVGQDGNDYVFAEPDCNNGDTQDIYLLRVNTTSGKPAVTVQKRLTIFDSNIGRGHCAVTGNMQISCVANVGNNRPANAIGVANIDVKTGTITHKAIVAKSDRQAKTYVNQAKIIALPNGKLAVMHTVSQGRGTDGNRKITGAPERAVIMTLDGTTLQPIDKTTTDESIIPFARHFNTFLSHVQADGTAMIGAVAGSPAASGPASARMIGIDAAGKITIHPTVLPVANNADTQYWIRIANNNAQNQGRGYLTPLVGVVNPGFGQVNGFMPEVKSFTVIPTAHFAPDELTNPKVRNSAYLSFVPTEVQDGLKVTMNGVVDVNDIKPGSSPRSADDGSAIDPFGPHGSNSQGGCSVGAVGTESTGYGAFALVGLGLAFVSLRRRSV